MKIEIESNETAGSGIPLFRCLDKFTESEKIEDVVCPTCKSDKFMSKRFALWRLPPVLVVHLKRFQFDRTNRRKLTNKVDFPLEGLDLTRYLAPSKLHDIDYNDHSEGSDVAENTDRSTSHRDIHSDIKYDSTANCSTVNALLNGGFNHEKSADHNDDDCDDENNVNSAQNGSSKSAIGSTVSSGNSIKENIAAAINFDKNNNNNILDEEEQTVISDRNKESGGRCEKGNINSSKNTNINIENNNDNANRMSNNNSIAMNIKGTDGVLYDLYSVVHHIGALGGGHYVTTTRDRERGPASEGARKIARQLSRSSLSPSVFGTVSPTPTPDVEVEVSEEEGGMVKANLSGTPVGSEQHVNGVNNCNNGNKNGSSNNKVGEIGKDKDKEREKEKEKERERLIGAAPPPGGQWWCYNDDVVTEVMDPREVSSASAYVLFYMRRDVWGMDVKDIFEQSRRNSMGVLLSSKDNTGTLTGSTSRTNESSVRSVSSNGSNGLKNSRSDTDGYLDPPRGFWRPRLPAVVPRGHTSSSSTHAGMGEVSMNASALSASGAVKAMAMKARKLAPVAGSGPVLTSVSAKDGQGHAHAHAVRAMPLSARLSLRSLAQSQANFSGSAGDDEDESSNEDNGSDRGDRAGQNNANDADRCAVS